MFVPTFLEHKGHRLLRLDYRSLSPRELLDAFHSAARALRTEPAGSVRVLTLLPPHFDGRSADAWKELGAANAAYVRASAVVARGFWRAVITTLQLHGRKDLQTFADERSALEWLASR